MNDTPLRDEDPQKIAAGSASGFKSTVDALPKPPPFPDSYSEKLLPWYFQKVWIIIVALNVPPLALPMIIAHPTLPLRKKIGYSLLIPLLVWVLWISVMKTWEAIQNLLQTLDSMGA